MRVRFFLIVSLIFWLPGNATAADQVASSCSAADIQSAVNTCISTGGGTVTVPACNTSWAENTKVVITTNTVYVKIIGAGKASTIITWATTEGNDIMFNNTGSAGLQEIGGMTLVGNNYTGTSAAIKNYSPGIDNFIIHDIKFQNWGGYVVALCQSPDSPWLIYNCEWDTCRTYGISVYGPASNALYQIPHVLGSSNPNALFVEDCTFTDVVGHAPAGFAGANIVFRHNTTTGNGTGIDGHAYGYGVGCGYGAANDIYGQNVYEIYDNEWANPSTDYCVRVRSGMAIVTDNTMGCKSAVTLVIEDKIIEEGGPPPVPVLPDEVTGTDSNIYTCIWPHTSTSDSKPITGGSWETYWTLAGSTGGTWATSTYYRPRCYTQSGCVHSDDSSYLEDKYHAPDLCYSVPDQWWIWNNDHTYEGAGKELIKLTEGSTQTSGCIRENEEYFLRAPQVGDSVESYTKYTYPHPLRGEASAPTAAFSGTPLSGPAPLTVAFTDLSTNTPTSWSWDFDNNGTADSTVQNPTYTYSTVGSFTVKLTATNGEGSDDETKAAYVTTTLAGPTAAFSGTPLSGVAPLEVTFTDASSEGTGTIDTWSWDFQNDGTPDSTVQNPVYTYSGAGSFTVKLTVTDDESQSDSETKTSYVNANDAPTGPSGQTGCEYDAAGATVGYSAGGVTIGQ